MRDLLGGNERRDRGGGQHIPHRRLGELTPGRQARRDPLPEPRNRPCSADHLDQHREVAFVQVCQHDLPRGVDQFGHRSRPVQQAAVGGHPPLADVLERGDQQVGD